MSSNNSNNIILLSVCSDETEMLALNIKTAKLNFKSSIE